MFICLSDNQDITRAGVEYLLQGFDIEGKVVCSDKTALVEQLRWHPQSLVIIDYTLFDINDSDELLILCQRFPSSLWLLFSDDLSVDFVRRLVASTTQIGVIFKDVSIHEMREGLQRMMHGLRYICQRMTEMLLVPEEVKEEKVNLTKTEVEILKDIAMGMTTKEIAVKRFSSFHTVNTHRKNIFRKLEVNNVHEAIRYALRAGLVDAAEYYI